MTAQHSTKSRGLKPVPMLALALLLSALAWPAGAQDKKPSTPFQGFSSNNDNPVNIKADQLETHQDEQKAIFTGHVVATQGESVLNAEELTVYYEAAASPPDKAPAEAPAPAGTQASAAPQNAAPAASLPADAAEGTSEAPANKVKKLVAKGQVVVTAQDQKATGDDGILDMETNIATLTGEEVVMSQGCNVMRGKMLVVHTETGLATVTGGTTGHFVSGDQKC